MNRAFSLVELSIVLVILGLLTGGILAGQSLIHASELRAASTEYTNYKSAVYGFRDKYFALPGDMTNATKFWGDDTATCSSADPNGTPGTCNGNGNGFIDTAPGAGATSEIYRFWQQLALAGLISGNYTGINDANAGTTRGLNTPPSKLGSACWSMFTYPTVAFDGVAAGWANFEGAYGNTFILGNSNSLGRLCELVSFRPEDAWNIDTKMDDGRPGLGMVRTYETYTDCQDAGISSSAPRANVANYKLSDTNNTCILLFNL